MKFSEDPSAVAGVEAMIAWDDLRASVSDWFDAVELNLAFARLEDGAEVLILSGRGPVWHHGELCAGDHPSFAVQIPASQFDQLRARLDAMHAAFLSTRPPEGTP